jgi:hypothetical protein
MIPIRPNPARAERRCRQPGIRIIEIGRILHDQMDLQRQLPLSPGEGGDDSSAYAYEVRIQAASLSALEISLIVGFSPSLTASGTTRPSARPTPRLAFLLGSIDAVNLKDVLGKINSDRANLHVDGPLM